LNELCRLTASAAVDLLRRREVSPLDLIEAAAARIAETEPRLNALPILCLDRARERAERLMREPSLDAPPPHLHGLPIAVKDNVEVEGVRCTLGSPIFADRVAPCSDIVVQRLERRGALVIGKSNIPEFAAGGTTFNEVFGVTRNPWNTAMTPGGSSGGTGAALAAGQVWLGTGNDFGGSIRLPSSFCSLVGLRPTAGLVPRIQKQPYSALNVEGPMARTVADCALMLECETGQHPLDPLSAPVAHGSFMAAAATPQRPSVVAFSLDLGVAPVVDPEVARVCLAAMQKLEAEGCRVEEAAPDLRDAEKTFLTLRGAAFVANMGPILDAHRDALKPEVIANVEFGLGLGAVDIARAEVAQGEIVRRMAGFFEGYDALICPASLCPPIAAERRYLDSLHGVVFDSYLGWAVMTCVISVTGCPVLALPVGFTADGLPIGVQIVGPPRSEARLFAIGAYLERLFDVAPHTPIDPRPALEPAAERWIPVEDAVTARDKVDLPSTRRTSWAR
jgi:amidase